MTLIAAVLVLGGALAAGHRHRVYDAVVLKTLGATRGRLLAAYALEYLLLGRRHRAVRRRGRLDRGLAGGDRSHEPADSSGCRRRRRLRHLARLLVTVAFGLIGTFAALGHKPATVLRNL